MRKQLLVIGLIIASMMPISCSTGSANNGVTADPEHKIDMNTQQATQKKDQKSSKVIKLTKADFLIKVADYEKDPTQWKYLGDKPAIIDFYADWCGPCRRVAPILDELAEEYDGDIYIYKIDVDKEKELAMAFGIRSVPSILFVPMEGSPQLARGALPKTTFEEAIEEVLLIK